MTRQSVSQAIEHALAQHRSGQAALAEQTYRQILAADPTNADALHLLGALLFSSRRYPEAVELIERAIAVSPRTFIFYNTLGAARMKLGQLDAAMAAFRTALQLNPNYPDAYINVGALLRIRNQLEPAVAAYQAALKLKPESYEAYNNLGNALKLLGRLDEARAAFEEAVRLKPDYPEAIANLANVLKDQGRVAAAVEQSRRAIAVNPDYYDGHCNLIYTLYFHPDYDTPAIAAELKKWNQRHIQPIRRLPPPQADPNPDRKLRIGYISPELRAHVVGLNLYPLLSHHDRKRFEIYCYSDVSHPDQVTGELNACTDQWRHIVGVNDENVAKMIRDDRVDILVDLGLHMAGCRLRVFAFKPAPVQATYLGYCGSTGVEAVDYRLSDPHLDPPDTDLSYYTEKTLRLPASYWCYQPAGPCPDVGPLPALGNGFVTFGCLNNFAKVSPAAYDLWAKLLEAVPNSRLLLHTNPGNHLEAVGKLFPAGRIEFVPSQKWTPYTQTYNRIDLALDPFPYGGGITTCDGLWMGVPVITLSGKTAVGRGGRSILNNVGFQELVAHTPQEYLKLSVELSNDLPRLAEMRGTLRSRMAASPLMDATRFARDVENAYRQMFAETISRL